MWLLVASAAVFLVCAAGGGVFVFVRTRELFRHLRAFGGATDEALARLAASDVRASVGRITTVVPRK
ncbi:MAG: hypothetical protein LC790_03520 [Actinobacteria bacterium]|nr:hypothetical protein [Actinomycetota bacterium]